MTEARLTALVVGTDDWAADQAAGALRRGGATVLRCHEPGEPTFPCNAFIPGRVCPLTEGFDVAVTARARSSRSTEPGEVGAVCALRTGHPLVVAGVTASNPFATVAVTEVGEAGDLVTACRDAVGDERAPNSEQVIDLRPAHS